MDAACEDARELGYEIVHLLTTELWGLRRFGVRAPGGDVVGFVLRHDWDRRRRLSVRRPAGRPTSG